MNTVTGRRDNPLINRRKGVVVPMTTVAVTDAIAVTTPQLSSQKSDMLNPLDLLPKPAMTLDEAKQRIALLRLFVQEMLVPGQDYGLIPGCKKPSLLKPGAEKLCDIFGFAKHVVVLHQVEDWERGVFAYTVKVILVSKGTGLTEAEGQIGRAHV